MANVLNYAEKWAPQLLEAIIQGTLCSPFVTNNVNWLSAKTFHFTHMTTSGYKNHNRAGGWNRGAVTQADVPFTLYHDRDVEFLVDKADVDETNQTAAIQNISSTFTELQANPEIDAEFFGKIYSVAKTASLVTATELSTYTAENVFGKIKAMMKAGKLRTYRQRGTLLCYVSSDIMDLLERSKDFTRQINVTQIADGGTGIETRVTEIDGVTLFEVMDTERFYTGFNFSPEDGGFEPIATAYALTADVALTTGKAYYTKSGDVYTLVASPVVGSIGTYYEITASSAKINVLFASTESVKNVPKINSIYFFAPGTHTVGDGYLYQNRAYSGTFVFPNGKNNEVDSVFVDIDNATIV